MVISKQEGLRGIYKGYWATLLSFGPFSALYFGLYEKVGCGGIGCLCVCVCLCVSVCVCIYMCVCLCVYHLLAE